MSQRGAGKRDWGGWTCEYRRPRIRRNKDSGDGTTWENNKRKTEVETVSTET